MTGRQKWVISGAVALALAIVVYFISTRPPHETAAPSLEITLAVNRLPSSSLVQVAEINGYFREEGLAVTIEWVNFGRQAMEMLLQGKAHFATVGETPITVSVLNGNPVVVVAGIFSSDRSMGVVARRDRGIDAPGDLRGKTIGTPFGTVGHYFFHAFHTVEGLREGEFTLVDMLPNEMEEALQSGRVDAVSIWDPLFSVIQRKLGEGGVSFTGGHIYTYTLNLVAMRDYAETHPRHIVALLKALLKAETFIRNHPAQAGRIVAEHSGWDKTLLNELWKDFSFRLSLDQALLVNMENQARWAMETGVAPSRSQLNFLDVMYLDGLETVAPSRITIAR